LKELFPFHNIENDSEINDNIKITYPINLDELESMLLDPFDLNEEGGLFSEIDPDANFFNDHASNLPNSCKYTQPEKLKSSLDKMDHPISLSLLHLNIRSTRQNYSPFTTFLHTLDHPFSLLGLTETWLKPHNAQLFNIDGYTHEFLTRDNKVGGGLSLYIKDNLEYKVWHDLNHVHNDHEMLWVEIEGKYINSKINAVVGLIYRRPGSNIEEFNDLLSNKLNLLSSENKTVIHMGDYNLDLLKHDSHIPTNAFLDINLTYSLLPVINKPTRVTRSSATIIDNLFSNIIDDDDSLTCIFPIDISDHFPNC
jgi:hypothetical protein